MKNEILEENDIYLLKKKIDLLINEKKYSTKYYKEKIFSKNKLIGSLNKKIKELTSYNKNIKVELDYEKKKNGILQKKNKEIEKKLKKKKKNHKKTEKLEFPKNLKISKKKTKHLKTMSSSKYDFSKKLYFLNDQKIIYYPITSSNKKSEFINKIKNQIFESETILKKSETPKNRKKKNLDIYDLNKKSNHQYKRSLHNKIIPKTTKANSSLKFKRNLNKKIFHKKNKYSYNKSEKLNFSSSNPFFPTNLEKKKNGDFGKKKICHLYNKSGIGRNFDGSNNFLNFEKNSKNVSFVNSPKVKDVFDDNKFRSKKIKKIFQIAKK